jgi:hypothetical protein
MIRIFLLVCFVAFAIAFRFLPWWGKILLPVLVILVLYFFTERILTMLFMIPFRMKGKVLRGATAKVHSVRSITAPPKEPDEIEAEEQSPPDPTPVDHFEIDVTIIPKGHSGGFQLWEPSELVLIRPESKPVTGDDESCSTLKVIFIKDSSLQPERKEHFAKLTGVESPEELDDDDSPDGKYFGPQRIQMTIRVKRGVKKLVFAYYFEKFGEVELV